MQTLTMHTDQLPPHSINAEAAALGAVLLAGEQGSQTEADALLIQLRPTHFYDLRHKAIHAGLVGLRMDGHALCMLALVEHLKAKRQIESVGGVAYLGALPDAIPSVAQFPATLAILTEKHWRRYCLQKAGRLGDLAAAEDIGPDAVKRELADLIERTDKLGAAGRPLLQIFDPEQAKAYQPDPNTFLLGAGMICTGEISVIAGWAGLGKSRLSTTLAIALARGAGSWMHYPIRRRARTLILQAQNSLYRLQTEYADLDPELSPYIRMSGPVSLAFGKPEFRQEVRRFCEGWPPDLVIVDPWNVVARAEGGEEYLDALDNIRDALPNNPAICILAHLRKQRGGDNWRPKVGRALQDEISGSFALTADARAVFVVQPATLDLTDDRLVFDVAKCSNDQPLPRSAWYRRNQQFEPCPDFNFEEWENPPDEGGHKSIDEGTMAALWRKEGPTLSKAEAAKLLKAAGFSQATAYRALELNGKFSGRLYATENGRLAWNHDNPPTP